MLALCEEDCSDSPSPIPASRPSTSYVVYICGDTLFEEVRLRLAVWSSSHELAQAKSTLDLLTEISDGVAWTWAGCGVTFLRIASGDWTTHHPEQISHLGERTV